ncbi:MAG: AzlC family ABC transporter permease [Psychrobacter sp.]|nr:AzlC family ABC transporter permease [Psychrobacter sp.]
MTHDWSAGLKRSLPVAMGYLPAGIAFGVLASVAGLPVWATLLLSVVLYAGAAQYACLPMLATGLPIASVATNIAAINLRHVFYALPLLEALPKAKLARLYCLFALTDETFSLLTSLPIAERASLILPVSLFNQSWWVIATALGLLIGPVLNDWVPHLDFAIVCLFAILAYEQYRLVKSLRPPLIALIALIIAHLLTSSWLLITAIIISILFIMLPLMITFITPFIAKQKRPSYQAEAENKTKETPQRGHDD